MHRVVTTVVWGLSFLLAAAAGAEAPPEPGSVYLGIRVGAAYLDLPKPTNFMVIEGTPLDGDDSIDQVQFLIETIVLTTLGGASV